jgi:hypothetical protein
MTYAITIKFHDGTVHEFYLNSRFNDCVPELYENGSVKALLYATGYVIEYSRKTVISIEIKLVQ